MANITVAVPDDVYRAAKIRAAEAGTSVSALVAEYLRSLSIDPAPRTLGGWDGKVAIAEDFDEPLPPEIQAHFDPPVDDRG